MRLVTSSSGAISSTLLKHNNTQYNTQYNTLVFHKFSHNEILMCLVYLLFSSLYNFRQTLDYLGPFIFEADVNGILWTTSLPSLMHNCTNHQLKNVMEAGKPHEWLPHSSLDEKAGT